MSRTSNLFQRTAFAAVGLLLMAPGAAMAQDDVVSLEPSTLILTMVDGTEAGQYTVNDVGVYLSSVAGLEGEPTTSDLSLSLSAIAPIDANLLQWAAQTGAEGENLRNLTITTTAGTDGTAEMRYEITGASITSFSASHSTYSPVSVSLQIVAEQVTLDGVALN
jgi:hypothetical protein